MTEELAPEQPQEPIAREKGEAGAEEVLEDYYTIQEVASMFKFSTAWITDLCQEGRIRAFKPTGGRWRIPKAEVEKLRKEGLPPPAREKPVPKATEITVPAEKVRKVKPQDEGPGPEEESEKAKKGRYFPLPFDLD